MTTRSTAFDRDAILHFWLGEDFPSDAAIQAAVPRWFAKDAALDARIRERFGVMIDAALHGDFDDAIASADDRLAVLILLDQFPRNAFRDTPRAFAGDERALRLALDGLERGDDQQLHPVARLFCYLPLEHSEDLAMQDLSVALFQRLRDEAAANDRPRFDEWLAFAVTHRDLIARFGRFPHRNALLGRASSADELAYLAQPGAGF